MENVRSDRTEASFADQTLAGIATTLPGATAVLQSEKLDFCCGGGALLRGAAAAKRSDIGGIVAKVESLAATAEPAAAPQGVDALITLIETRCHQAHRRESPERIWMARRIEAVHRSVASAPAGLADRLERVAAELESHMQTEEQILFPLMRQGGNPTIGGPIRRMTAEHDDRGARLRAIETLTDGFTPPDEACTTWRALYTGTQKFADDLVEHIHIENNQLFPRFVP
jgi:regulator of cell morphogenesis and NO signaling